MEMDILGLLITVQLSDRYVPHDNWESFLDELSEHPQYALMETMDNSGVFHQYAFLFNVENSQCSPSLALAELKIWINTVFNKWSILIP